MTGKRTPIVRGSGKRCIELPNEDARRFTFTMLAQTGSPETYKLHKMETFFNNPSLRILSTVTASLLMGEIAQIERMIDKT